MKPFERIDNRLVMDMPQPVPESPRYYIDEYNSRPSYPINPADLDKFEEGKQYWEGKDFRVSHERQGGDLFSTAFPLPTPNDRREKKQKEESDVERIRQRFKALEHKIDYSNYSQLAQDCWLFLTDDSLPEKAKIKKDAFLHEVKVMIESAVLFNTSDLRKYFHERVTNYKTKFIEAVNRFEEQEFNQGEGSQRSVATPDQSGNKKPETK